MLDLIAMGDCTVELWCETFFDPAVPIQAVVGGETVRTCLCAAAGGLRSGFVSKLGDDLFEPFVRGQLTEAGLDLSLCPTVPGINGVAFGWGPEGKRKWIPYRAETAASTLRFEDLDPSYLRQTAVFLASALFQALSSSTRGAVRAACELAAASGIRTVFAGCFNTRIWPVQTACGALQELLPAVEVYLTYSPVTTG
jgi:2-dehydro-3-deoxygluconokinase